MLGLTVDDLTVTYGAVTAVDRVDLEVARGEIVAVLGANGAGKTSLLEAIAGHVAHTGVIRVGERTISGPPHRRTRAGIGFVADDRCLFPSLTVRQSLRVADVELANACVLFPPLEMLARRRGALCSGGEQQMLALARAVARRPEVLIVDELSLGLAPVIRHDLLAMLRRSADEGMAILVVEQHTEAILGVADRAVLLQRGRVVGERPAADWRLDEISEVMLS